MNINFSKTTLITLAIAFCLLNCFSITLAQGGDGSGAKKTTPKPTVSKPTTPTRQSQEGTVRTKLLSKFVPRAPEIEMVKIPAGSFMMESDDETHRVKIDNSFYIGKYEITQFQWEMVMGNNPSHFKKCNNCPVEHISWNNAKEYIRKLNSIQNEYEYRLPSSAEWEYAAQAETNENKELNEDAIGWYGVNSNGKPHPVGQKQPSKWGLYDVQGNVMEWVEDVYPNNKFTERVVRDCSFVVVFFCSITSYQGLESNNNFNETGFRIAAQNK